jgi:hypothetical protein
MNTKVIDEILGIHDKASAKRAFVELFQVFGDDVSRSVRIRLSNSSIHTEAQVALGNLILGGQYDLTRYGDTLNKIRLFVLLDERNFFYRASTYADERYQYHAQDGEETLDKLIIKTRSMLIKDGWIYG